MRQRELEITILANGQVEVQIKGYKGKKCHDVAKILEQIVGELKSRQETSEFYEPEEQVRYQIDQRL